MPSSTAKSTHEALLEEASPLRRFESAENVALPRAVPAVSYQVPDVREAATPTQLQCAFAGKGDASATGPDTTMDQMDHEWCFCIVVSAGTDKTVPRALAMAQSVFEQGFKGEEVVSCGISLQHQHKRSELDAFKAAVEEISGDYHWEGNVAQKHVFEALRNVVITKLTLHCALTVKSIFTADHEKVMLVISCDEDDLRREADRQGMHCEFDVVRTDLESLEPCSANFIPLSQVLVPKHAQLQSAFEKVLEAAREIESNDAGGHHPDAQELAVHEGSDPLDVTVTASFVQGLARRVTLVHNQMEQLAAVSAVWSTVIHDDLVDAYGCYLDLQASGMRSRNRQARDPLWILKSANDKSERTSGKRPLRNLWGYLGFEEPIAAHCPYSISLPPQVWNMHRHKLQARPNCEAESIHSPFSSIQRLKLLKAIIDRQVDLRVLQMHGMVEAVFPLDSSQKDDDGILRDIFSFSGCNPIRFVIWLLQRFDAQALQKMRSYYGEKIALYFAFLSFYLRWLWWPALFGILVKLVEVFLESKKADETEDNPSPGWLSQVPTCINITYTLMMTCWACMMLEGWKRYRNILVLKWGTQGFKDRELPRPDYYGDTRRSPITDVLEIHYSGFTRFLKQMFGYSILLLLLCTAGVLVLEISKLRDHWEDTGFKYGGVISGILNAVQINVFNSIGLSLALKFNRWENYRTQTAFANALILKTFLFTFANSFYAFYFIAFIKSSTKNGCLPSARKPEGDCLGELQYQLTVIFMSQAFMNVVEVGGPWITYSLAESGGLCACIRNLFGRNSGNAGPTGPLVSLDAVLAKHLNQPEYDDFDVDGTLNDYAEIAVQFGFVTIFTVAFPLAPVGGLLLNILEMKTDGLKLYRLVRRPQPLSAEDIGAWFQVLQAITAISIMTNSALLVWTFEVTKDLPLLGGSSKPASDKLYFFVFCISLLVFRTLLSIAIPDAGKELPTIKSRLQRIVERVKSVDVRMPKENVSMANLALTPEEPGETMCDPKNFGQSDGSEGTRLRAGRGSRADMSFMSATGGSFMSAAGAASAIEMR